MLALTRPLFGLAVVFLLWGCSDSQSSGSVMNMPAILAGESTAKIFTTDSDNVVSTEDVLLFSMDQGEPPTRTDALSFLVRCWRPENPHRLLERHFQGPFSPQLSARQLVPEEALRPSSNGKMLNCLWDIYLKDDHDHINFQRDLPLTLKLEGGGMSLMLEDNPTEVLHEYIYEHYQLLAFSDTGAALEIHCEDLGSSRGVVTSSNFQALISGYLKATQTTPSHKDLLKCRLVARSDQEHWFTPEFSLIRNYAPLVGRLAAVLHNSGRLEVRAHIFNPNPFPAFALFTSAQLWKSLTVEYFGDAGHKVLDLGEGEAHWRLSPGFSHPLVKWDAGPESGYVVQVDPGSTVEVVSQTQLKRWCWSPAPPKIGKIEMQLSERWPIYKWKDGALAGEVLFPDSSQTVAVSYQEGNPALAKVCR